MEEIGVEHVPTMEQKADVLTKVLPQIKQVAALAQLGILNKTNGE